MTMTASTLELAPTEPLPLEQRLRLGLSPEDLQSQPLRQLYHDWFGLRTGPGIPDYATFDICNFRYVIGALNMMAVERDPWRFRYRVHASQAARNIGKDMTGKYVEEYPSAQYRDDIQQFFVHAAQRDEPSIDITANVLIFHRLMRYETVALPFGDAAGEITHLAVAISTSVLDDR